ncbi:MAG: hypothetical protein R3B48_27085 [Kofleriaceae bacterium]
MSARPTLAPGLVVLALAVAGLACERARPPDAASAERDGPPSRAPALEAAVARLLPSADLAGAVAELALPPRAFAEVVAPTYRGLYERYRARFPVAAAELAAQLQRVTASGPPVLHARRHYGGDATLSLAHARLRWALPVQAESWVVEADGVVLDAVWVRHQERWFALLGLEEAARAPLADRDAVCATLVERAGRAGACSDAAWMAIDAALAEDAARVARACARVAHFCR